MLNIFKKFSSMESLPVGLKSLYNHYVLRNVAFNFLTIFGPIFMYELSGSIEFVILVWLIISSAYFVFLPLWAKILKYASMHIFLIIGTFFASIYLLSYYFLDQKGVVCWWLFGIFIVFNLLNRLTYWIPYHVSFSQLLDHRRGRRISWLWIIISLLGIVVPIFSAFVIDKFGWSALFVFATFILLISIIPAWFIPGRRERYTFKYFESFKKIFSKAHIRTNIAYMADGWQSGVGYFIWPIFIFLLLKGEYLQVGLISAGIVLAECVLRFLIGEATDKFSKMKLIKSSSWLYSLGWFFKAISITATHIFLAGIYHSLMAIVVRTPFDALTYEIAADQGHYVDEFSVLREMSLHFGRALMFVCALIILSSLSIVWVFIITAVVSLFLNLITKEEFVY